jgi:hypothetical protein
LSGTQSIDGLKTFTSDVVVPSLNGISNTKINYLANVTSDIQTQINGLSGGGSSYVDLSSNQIITGNKDFQNLNSFQRIAERMVTLTPSSNTITLDYNTANIGYVTPASTTNMTLQITNFPLTTYQGASYTISLLLMTQTNKAYVNSVFVNGTSYIVRYAGGSSAISITSAIWVLQSITILVLPGTNTIGGVLSSVTQWF